MSRRRRSLVIVTDAKRGVLVVRGYKAGDLCREAGTRPIFSVAGRGWLLDLHRLPDLVAFAEWRNIDVRVTEAEEVA